LAKKSITELQALQKKLRQQFESRIKLNVSSEALNQTRVQLQAVDRALEGVKNEAEKTGNRLKQAFEKPQTTLQRFKSSLGSVFTAIGVTFGIATVTKFGKELFILSANAEGVRNGFERLNNPAL